MAQWFDDNGNAGLRPPFQEPIEHLAAIAALFDVPPRGTDADDLALVRWHLREAKRKGFDWERIYRVATTARPEDSCRHLRSTLCAPQSTVRTAVANRGVARDSAC